MNDRDWTRALWGLCGLLFMSLACEMVVSTNPVVHESGAQEAACYSLFSHCAEAWTAIGTFGLIVATGVLVVVGLYQALAIREDAKLNRTLIATERYFFDPIVDESQRRARKFKIVWDDPDEYRIDLQVILNQLDGLAFGIERHIYDGEFIRQNMHAVFAYHIVIHLDDVAVDRFRLVPSDFQALLRLDKIWGQYAPYAKAKADAKKFVLRLIEQGEWGATPLQPGSV